MKLSFQMIDETRIKIIATMKLGGKEESHEVGAIFTPTANDYTNAIQVCGFEEAFDLWSCGNYQRPRTKNHVMDSEPHRMKDIQLKFNFETIKKDMDNLDNICLKCFNRECSCECHEKYNNPFTVKRSQDLTLYKKGKVVKMR